MLSPFARPAIIIPRYTRQAFIERLQEHVFHKYMEGATYDNYHSRVTYTTTDLEALVTQDDGRLHEWNGYLKVDDHYFSTVQFKSVKEYTYVHLLVGETHLLTRLDPLQIWVRQNSDEPNIPWFEWFEDTFLTLDPNLLEEALDFL